MYSLFYLAAFSIFLFCISSVLVIIEQWDFLFSLNLFCVLCASCTFIGISSFRLENLLWLGWKHFLHLWAGILLFLVFLGLVFHSIPNSWKFCQEHFRFSVFFDQCIYFISHISSTWAFLFQLLYSVGETCLCSSWSHTKVFHFQRKIPLDWTS